MILCEQPLSMHQLHRPPPPRLRRWRCSSQAAAWAPMRAAAPRHAAAQAKRLAVQTACAAAACLSPSPFQRPCSLQPRQRRALPDARLQAAIAAACSWQECAALLARQGHAMDAMLVSSLVTRTVRLALRGGGGEGGQPGLAGSRRGRAADAAAWGDYLRGLAALALARLRSFRPQQLSNVLWGFAKLWASPGRAWLGAYLQEVERQLLGCAPRHLAQILWALATLGVQPPRRWLGSWLSESWDKLGAFNPQDAANVLWALATLRVQPPPEWLADLAAHTTGQLPRFKAQELSCAAWGFARLGTHPGAAWVAGAVGAAAQQGRHLTAQHAATLLWALATWGGDPPPGAVPLLADAALLQLSRQQQQQHQQSFRQQQQQLPQAACHALTSTLWALSRLRARLPPCRAAAAMQLLCSWQPALAPRQVASCAAALARLCLRPPSAWLQAAGTAGAEAELEGWAPTDLAQWAWACGQLGWAPGAAWWRACWGCSSAALEAATAGELAMLLLAAARGGCRPAEGWLLAAWARLATLLAAAAGARRQQQRRASGGAGAVPVRHAEGVRAVMMAAAAAADVAAAEGAGSKSSGDEGGPGPGQAAAGDAGAAAGGSVVCCVEMEPLHSSTAAASTPAPAAAPLAPRDIAALMWACAALRLAPPPAVFRRLMTAAGRQWGAFTGDELTAVVWSLGRLPRPRRGAAGHLGGRRLLLRRRAREALLAVAAEQLGRLPAGRRQRQLARGMRVLRGLGARAAPAGSARPA